MLANLDLVLEPGDRVRVVAPPDKMALIAQELGDNERRVSEFHPRGFSIGLLLGLLLGQVPIPLPGIGTLELGSAGGPLLVGLVLGWRERTGPLVWQAPHGVSFTLRQLGSLLFFGMAGTSGGAALRSAIASGDGYLPIAAGVDHHDALGDRARADRPVEGPRPGQHRRAGRRRADPTGRAGVRRRAHRATHASTSPTRSCSRPRW